MLKTILKISSLFALLLAMGCSSDDKGITPSDISDITAEAGEGRITLKWNMPEDGSIFYTKVTYYDHLAKRKMWRLSSTNELIIPNTRERFGEYEFALETFSKSDNSSGNIHTIKVVSGPAAITEKKNQITLKEEHLSTNAQEPSEGAIKNLLDNNTSTYFHTKWSQPVPASPHTMSIDMSWREPMKSFAFSYSPRNNANNKPTDFDLMGSMDGKDWFLIKNFKEKEDKLPTSSTASYTSPTIKSEKPFTYLKMLVNKTNSGSIFWTMSVFKLYDVEVYDPEAVEE